MLSSHSSPIDYGWFEFFLSAASFRRIFAAKLTWFLDGIPIINADITSHSDSSDEVSHEEVKKNKIENNLT